MTTEENKPTEELVVTDTTQTASTDEEPTQESTPVEHDTDEQSVEEDSNYTPTVTQTDKLSKEYSEEASPHSKLYFSMSDKFDKAIELLEEMVASKRKIADPEEAEWLHGLNRSTRLHSKHGAFVDSVTREDSSWQQGVDFEGIRLRAAKPSLDKKGNGSSIAGDQAIFHINSLVGIGSIVNVPLWNTGIWVTFKTPTDSELLELDRRIASEKVQLGSDTGGLIFSNTSAFINTHLINFALKHVISSSLTDNSVDNLKKVILVPDLPALIQGLASSIFVEGYPMSRVCINKSCRHLTKELVSLPLMTWVDNKSLTNDQRKHMNNRTGKMELSAIKDYQSKHRWVGNNDYVTLKEGALGVKFRIPTLEQYERSGSDWINGIIRTMEDAFSVPMVGEERNQYIIDQGIMTALRQYAHWVEKITTSTQHVVEDKETIEKLMEHLSTSDDITDKFFEEIAKFINSTAICIIAIPKYNCPKCNTSQKREGEESHPMLIPIDPVEEFFILQTRRILKN